MEEIIVEIPRCSEHEGFPGNIIRVAIPAKCECGKGDRAVKIWRGLSYDGSRRLGVDCWQNSCGCIDKYSMIREKLKEGNTGNYRVVSYNTPTTYEIRTHIQNPEHE